VYIAHDKTAAILLKHFGTMLVTLYVTYNVAMDHPKVLLDLVYKPFSI